MAIADPLGKARAARTPVHAARLMARLEHEISFDETASEEWHGHADEAIDELRARFPTARTLDAYLQPPASSPAARAGRTRCACANNGRRTDSGHRWARRAGLLALLVAIAAVMWRLARRLPVCYAAPTATVAVIFGWRIAAAAAFAGAMLVPLQHVREATHTTSRRP